MLQYVRDSQQVCRRNTFIFVNGVPGEQRHCVTVQKSAVLFGRITKNAESRLGPWYVCIPADVFKITTEENKCGIETAGIAEAIELFAAELQQSSHILA